MMKTHFLSKILEEYIEIMRLIPYGFQNIHAMHCKNCQGKVHILLADSTLLSSKTRYNEILQGDKFLGLLLKYHFCQKILLFEHTAL